MTGALIRPLHLPLILLATMVPAQSEGLVRNPGFEQGLDGWGQRNSEGMGRVDISAHTTAGQACALINKTVSTEKWSSIGVTQKIAAEPNSVYELSFLCRTELEADAVGWAFRAFIADAGKSRHRVVGSRPDWSKFTMEHQTGPQTKELTVSILLTYSSGKIWLDDVCFRRIGQSIEAEGMQLSPRARVVGDRSLSGAEGVAIVEESELRRSVAFPAGPIAITVYGRCDGDDPWRRAGTVAIAGQNKTVDVRRHGSKLKGRIAFFDRPAAEPVELIVSRADGYEGELVIDRVFWRRHHGPAKPKRLYLDTPLVLNGKPNAAIVSGQGPTMQRLARKLQDALADRTGARLSVVTDQSDYQSRHAIAVGNLVQNRLAERLYCLWYTREDGWYPGAGGHVVRTVHDPWGRGTNVLVLAGSDEAGTAAALDAFLASIEPGRDLVVPRLLDVKMAESVEQAIRKPSLDYARRSLKRRSQRSLIGSSARAAAGYLYTGDPTWAEAFMVYLMEHKRRPELGHDTHMELWQVVRGWDLLEECPALTDEDRLEVANYLLYVLRSPEGVYNSMFVGSLGYSSVRHNHHMLAAMDAYYGGRYFGLYYSLPDADEWLRKARFCFASQELQDKGQDESGNYEGSTSLRPLAIFASEEPGYRFLPSKAGKRFAGRVCMSIDNRFSSSGHGDCWDVNCFPRQALSLMAWYYRDGRYQYILNGRFDKYQRERDSWGAEPRFRMEGYLDPQRPADLEGVRTAPINAEFYRFYRKRQAERMQFNLPADQGFDKLSFRTAFEPDKQYLLLDGIALGSHGHADTNCIVRFTDNDRVWLVDDSYTEGPFLGDHNGVLVARDGMVGLLPACARLDAAVDLGPVGLSRTTAPDHSDTDWERNIFWVKEQCFVVMDRLVARQDGDYAFRCLWRTLGVAEQRGRNLVTQQRESDAEREDELHLVSCPGVRSAFRPERDVFGKRWARRYPHAKPVVNIQSQDVSRRLKKGESFTFANLLYATNRAEPRRFELARLDDDTCVLTGERRLLLGLADRGRNVAGLRVKAGQFMLWDTACAFTQASTLDVDGNRVLTASKPIAIMFDTETDRVIVDAPTETEVELLGEKRTVAGREVLERTLPSSISLSEVLDRATLHPVAEAVSEKAQRNFGLRQAWTFDAGSATTAMGAHDLDGDGDSELVVGTKDGRAIALSSSGSALWTLTAKGRQNAVAFGDVTGDRVPEIALACEDKQVYVLDAAGKLLWQFQCPRYLKRGGKYGEARVVHVADLNADGKAEVIVGANNMQLHVLASDGNELFRRESHDSKVVFDNLSAFDCDGDGRLEIFSFPSSGSFGRWHRWEGDGKHETGTTDGWPSCIPAAAVTDLDRDGRMDVAMGTNRGTVYFLRQSDKGLRQEKVFTPGCRIVAVAGHDGLVAVASEMAYLFVLDGSGRMLWKASTETSAVSIQFVQDARRLTLVAVATVDGSVLLFSTRGRLAGRFHRDSPVAAMVRVRTNGLAVGYRDGAVVLLDADARK